MTSATADRDRGVRDNREKSRRIATDVRFERGVPNSRKVSTGWRKGVVFVRERTRWSDERRTENEQYLVAIPTAGVGEVCGKSSKYTGSLGPTSLNLSHAVGVLAYEAFVETTLEEDRRRKSRNDDDDDGSSSSSSSSSCSNSDNNSGSAENTTASLRKQTNAGKMDTIN